MPTIGGLSFSKVGFQKNFSGITPATSSTATSSISINFNKILKNKLKNLISIKPRLIDYNLYSSLGFDAKLVGFDPNSQVEEDNKPMSPRLLNWVEPYVFSPTQSGITQQTTGATVSGFRKTLFYTEVNSGLKVGDRVFIINGNYDSDSLIKEDKYKRGRDGYKVLLVDECRVVLDIDYDGTLPWIEDDIDNFIKVHYVENQSDFDTVNRQLTTRDGKFDYRFNLYQNNFIYVKPKTGTGNIFNATTNGGPEFGINGGITSSGFFVKDNSNQLGYGQYEWYNMTSAFLQGSFSYALSPTYPNNNRLKVVGGSFTLPTNYWQFKKDTVYKWEVGPTQSQWVVDVKYSRPILTKTNFRDGDFDGIWNVGLFGQQNKKIRWTGNKSTWNTGTLLNTNWIKGTFNSKYTLPLSYFCEYDSYGLPSQKQTGPNNNGRGYNFLIDSDLNKSVIENGNLINTIIGLGTATFSSVEQHILGGNINYPNIIKKGYFDNCTFQNSKIENSEIRNGRAINTLFNNIKSINSYFQQSVVRNSDYISDEIVKISNYEELNLSEHRSTNLLYTSATFSQRNGVSHKLYKFYISKRDYERFKKSDYFYLKNILIEDGKKELVNFFDKKFKLGSWYEYFDDFYNLNDPNFTSNPNMGISSMVGTFSFYKRGVSFTSYLSTPKDNQYLFTTVSDGSNYWTELAGTNSNSSYSIDLVVSIYDKEDNIITGLDFDRQSSVHTIYTEETVKFTYIDTGTEFVEIRMPSGYYDSKPYYILTSNSGSTQGYIFYTASNSQWEHHQTFDPITGAVSGDFWMSLPETGNLPISSSFSWIQEINTNISITSSTVYNPVIAPPILNRKVQIEPTTGSKGYVIDSDFESGILERSNWNSGSNVGYGNDLNITKFSNSGGFYDLQILTQSSSLIAKTSLNNIYRESTEDLLKVGSVVFLNQVDYDTTGKISSIQINNAGTGYLNSSNVLLFSGSGTQSSINITANVIGSVTGLLGPANLAHTYPSGGLKSTTTTGPGTGLTVNATLSGSNISSVAIVNAGQGYQVGDVVEILGSPLPATFSITSITNGEIIAATISNGGIQYLENELLTVSGGNSDAVIEVISTTGSVKTLNDSYKITSITNDLVTLKEIATSSTIISTLLSGGVSYTKNSRNRWGYIHPLKINRTFVKSGLFRRTYLYNTLLENNSINLDDKDFNNRLDFKRLINIEILFRNNKNILARASYVNSNIVAGSDVWRDGLLYNSVWNSGTFSMGLIKESSWHSGRFVRGTFYQSKSFNATPNSIFQYYDSERIYTSWKSGQTSDILANDRYSWRKGTFVKGDFIKSDWEGGDFLDGKFYNSKWYSGTFSSGVIGDISLTSEDTKFYNGEIKTAIVNNASIYAIDTSFNGLSSSNIIWNTGTFNSGIFGCDILIQPTSLHTATWYDGEFNGGEFQTNGKWKTGVFNGGKFTSGFGWTYATVNQIDFGWEDGEFNGGEFGNSNLGTNSIWYTGEFNAGKFTGRLWNDGVFQSGDFIGSSTWSAVGGNKPDGMTTSNVDSFVDTFTSQFYGIWRSGLVTNNKDEFIKTKKIFTKQVRSIDIKRPFNLVNFKNMLWLGGTFSHQGGKFYNSAWLNGNFMKGKFELSSFNPYVKRSGSSTRSFNLNDDLVLASGSCVWQDGIFSESEFYISQWKTGKFISGTAYGMIWKNGTANYMNAYNVFWEDGTWKNGNWNGSYIQYDGSITSDFNRQILFRGMNYNGTSSVHFWNVFEEIQSGQSISQMDAATPTNALLLTQQLPSGPVSGPVIPSDFKLKKNLELVETVEGINVYNFQYIDRPNEIYQGVIAQELIGTDFEDALILVDDTYLVDYSKLKIKFKKII